MESIKHNSYICSKILWLIKQIALAVEVIRIDNYHSGLNSGRDCMLNSYVWAITS